jgi:serine/threonine-protein kinase HipA
MKSRGGPHRAERITPFYDVLSAWPIMGARPNHRDPRQAKLPGNAKPKSPPETEGNQTEVLDGGHQVGWPRDASSLLHEVVTTAGNALETARFESPPEFPAVVRDRVSNGLVRSSEKSQTCLPNDVGRAIRTSNVVQ